MERCETNVSELVRQATHAGEPFVFTDKTCIVLNVAFFEGIDQKLLRHPHQGFTILQSDLWCWIGLDFVILADIAADQLKEARLRRRQRLEEINHPPDSDISLSEAHV